MLEKLFDGSFMPHGHCFLWREDLLALHVAGNFLTFVAYGIIPFGLVHIVRHRDDLRYNGIFMLFAAFILFCGLTHGISLLNIWHGYYYIEGVVAVITGVVSILTAILLWRMMPGIVAIPSSSLLAKRNSELLEMQAQLREINEVLELRVRERTADLERLASSDSLTGLKNHQAILDATKEECERYRRYDHPLSLIMLDLDNFKSVNDELGHQAGDMLLKMVADVLNNSCRATDLIGRYGGEEFVVVCCETTLDEAVQLAERIRLNIESASEKQPKPVTASFGVAVAQPGVTAERLIGAADQALFDAKGGGRNRTVSAEPV